MTDTELRWQSARDAWQWALEVETTRAMLQGVHVKYAQHTAAPGFLLETAGYLLKDVAEREVVQDSAWEVWAERLGVFIGIFLFQFVPERLSNKPILPGIITHLVVALILMVGFASTVQRREMSRRRHKLTTVRTTPAPFDKVRDHQLPDDPPTEVMIAHAGWRAATLAQSARILVERQRIDSARKAVPYEDDITLAVLYLSGAAELLKGLSDYVEAEKRVASCGE